MKHMSDVMHFFLYHIVPVTIALIIFFGGIYLVIKDAKHFLKDKEPKQKLSQHRDSTNRDVSRSKSTSSKDRVEKSKVKK